MFIVKGQISLDIKQINLAWYSSRSTSTQQCLYCHSASAAQVEPNNNIFPWYVLVFMQLGPSQRNLEPRAERLFYNTVTGAALLANNTAGLRERNLWRDWQTEQPIYTPELFIHQGKAQQIGGVYWLRGVCCHKACLGWSQLSDRGNIPVKWCLMDCNLATGSTDASMLKMLSSLIMNLKSLDLLNFTVENFCSSLTAWFSHF